MSSSICLGQSIDISNYPSEFHDYLLSFPVSISVYELWEEMDRVWNTYLAIHGGVTESFLADFYSHPVWCLNSIFTSFDVYSSNQRRSLVHSLQQFPIKSIVDMGGGYGVLCLMIKALQCDYTVSLCEPYIHPVIRSHLMSHDIYVKETAPKDTDCYIYIDVLEHCTRPIHYLYQSICQANLGSYFYIGNCFYPVIKCHLPQTFYLRFTFNFAAYLLGLTRIGSVSGAPYINIFRLTRRTSLDCCAISRITKTLFILISPLHYLFSWSLLSLRMLKRLITS